MIGKVIKGRSFRSLCVYLLNGDRGSIIGGNMAGTTPRELAKEFGAFRKLRPNLSRAVAHIPLSAHPDDRHLSNAEWREIADTVAKGLGFEHCARVLVRHIDTEHEHVHLVLSRIDLHGKTVSDANDFQRAEKLLRQIERDHGLKQVAVAGAGVPRPKRKSTKPKEANMQTDNNTENPTPPNTSFDDQAPMPEDDDHGEMMEIQDPLSYAAGAAGVKRRRQQQRSLKEPNYEQWVKEIFGNEVQHIHHHPKGRVIYFDKPKSLRDNGDSLVAKNMSHEEAAQRLLDMATAKGWKSVTFRGNTAFLEIAIRRALKAGVQVVPADVAQVGIIDKVRAELAVEAAARMNVHTQVTIAENPIGEGLLGKLLDRRKQQGSVPSNYVPPKPKHPGQA